MSERKITTTRCSKVGHPEFILAFDSAIPEPDIDWLVSFLESSVQAGSRYKKGQTLSLGSMLLQVEEMDDLLTLQEPDLRAIPIEWTTGVTSSLQLLRLHKDVAESVGLGNELDPPSIRSSLLIGVDLAPACETLFLERVQPVEYDSGWFVGRADTSLDYQDSANLECISVYQSIVNWPRIAGFLALPVGCRVDAIASSMTISRYGHALEVRTGSFLEALSRKANR